MRIYLDCCCFNRLFDEQSRERIRIEVFAIERIMAQVRSQMWTLVGSDVLSVEVGRIRNSQRREALQELLAEARVWVELTESVIAKAQEFGARGLGNFDAIHVASAMPGGQTCC